jgi:hypothetical protein
VDVRNIFVGSNLEPRWGCSKKRKIVVERRRMRSRQEVRTQARRFEARLSRKILLDLVLFLGC